jgi:hypothetical protein
MVGGDPRSRSGHVLHQETGISRDVLVHVRRQEACPDIVAIAVLIADDDRDGLTLIERRLGLRAPEPQ